MKIPPYNYLEYYKLYNLDYWPSKIAFLKNTIENFQELKPTLYKDLDAPNDDNFILALKTDLHFLYFQMVETLFELIFALQTYDERNLWYYLSFSDRNNYNKIKDISEGDNKLFVKEISLMNPKNKSTIKIPFLRFVFFHLLDLKKLGIPEKENITIISKLLRKFSLDFSDRNEYNAFKHSMRLIYEKPNPKIETVDKKHSFVFEGDNAFTYIEKYNTKEHAGISIITKSFYPEIDIKLCMWCSWLIFNIIVTRKNYYFKSNENILTYETLDIDEINKMYSGLGRMEQHIYKNK